MAHRLTQAANIRSYVTPRSLSSSAGSSKYPYKDSIVQSNFWLKRGPGIPDCCEPKYQTYNLNDLYHHLLCSPFRPEFGGHEESAKCCQEVLQSIVQQSENRNIEIAVECEIPKLCNSGVSDLLCTKHQRPDLYMHLGDDLTAETIVEIHCSPYEDTIRKALITATDLLRLRRMYSDTNTVTAFCFPKLKTKKDQTIRENKQCVVKLEITWKDFVFRYILTPIVKIDEVKENIINGFRALTGTEKIRRVVMRLSIADLQCLGQRFGQRFGQIPSNNAIMVQSDTHVLKLPMWCNELDALERCRRSVCSQNVSTFVIQLTLEEVGDANFYMYTRVYYDPMNCDEARKCLKQFYCSVRNSLRQLHNILELAHLDIRLDNICFNQSFQPVFIDLDRNMTVSEKKVMYTDSHSCMYVEGMRAGHTDWIQLGWLIAWVLDENCTDYHGRTFENLSETLQGSETLQALIQLVQIECVRMGTQVWPEKVGELLASMYLFGTLNYLNNLRNTPANILWTTYGLLAIRDTGCLVLKMTLDETRCSVQLMHEGGVFSLGPAIEYVVNSIKAAQ